MRARGLLSFQPAVTGAFVCVACARTSAPVISASTRRSFTTTQRCFRKNKEPWEGNIMVDEKDHGMSGLDSLKQERELQAKLKKWGLPKTPARTRFAPSPTGYLHIGSLRTALYNYLLAKATGGQFILRVEDTDQTRIVGDAEKKLSNDLKWAGLNWDEGPDIGGPFGPYRQSERLDIYRPHADYLLEKGHAFRCFCSAQDLEKHKEEAVASRGSLNYPGTCREIPREESDARAAKGEPHVVRFKGGASAPFVDRVYGKFKKREPEDDFILIKSDGYPTYHFANVVDDRHMRITHVIRGNEWLISTPKHIALYKAFDWTPPEYSHVGLLVDGAGQKLSKRNFDVDIASYRKKGILPFALNNWLVLLGWGMINPLYKAEFFKNMDDMILNFSFKFTKGNIKVNPEKLNAFQHKQMDALLAGSDPASSRLFSESVLEPSEALIRDADLRRHKRGAGRKEQSSTGRVINFATLGDLIPVMEDPGSPAARAYIVKLFQNNTTKYEAHTDLIIENPYLIWRVDPKAYANAAKGIATFSWQKLAVPMLNDLRLVLIDFLQSGPNCWTPANIRTMVLRRIEAHAATFGGGLKEASTAFYGCARYALTGDPNMPSKPTSMIMYLLGPEESFRRISLAQMALQSEFYGTEPRPTYAEIDPQYEEEEEEVVWVDLEEKKDETDKETAATDAKEDSKADSKAEEKAEEKVEEKVEEKAEENEKTEETKTEETKTEKTEEK